MSTFGRPALLWGHFDDPPINSRNFRDQRRDLWGASHDTMTPRLRRGVWFRNETIKLKGDVETFLSGFFKGEFLTSNLGGIFFGNFKFAWGFHGISFQKTEDFPVFQDFFWFGDWSISQEIEKHLPADLKMKHWAEVSWLLVGLVLNGGLLGAKRRVLWNRIWHQGAAESYVKEANWNSQIFTWLDQIPDDLEVSQGWPFRWDDHFGGMIQIWDFRYKLGVEKK